jgi:aminoglycoside 3-N-acetyltransferase
LRFGPNYEPLRRDHLDPTRLELYTLALHLSLVAGPSYLLTRIGPDPLMQDIVAHNTERLIELAAAASRRCEHSPPTLWPPQAAGSRVPESDVITRSDAPQTAASLAADLRELGLTSGSTVIVHTSLSALGWVVGGPVAVIRALEAVLGDEGTLVMPTQTVGLSDPSEWGHPPVPEPWWQQIRDAMPLYDPALTPTLGVGVVPEVFRSAPGVQRSGHPLYSFAARGPSAVRVAGQHGWACGLGETSPLAALYELDAHVLLLGVDHSANTSLHLSEYRLPRELRREREIALPAELDATGRTRWRVVDDIDLVEDDFAAIGREYVNAGGHVQTARVGAAGAQLLRQRDIVDFGVEWMCEHRTPARAR